VSTQKEGGDYLRQYISENVLWTVHGAAKKMYVRPPARRGLLVKKREGRADGRTRNLGTEKKKKWGTYSFIGPRELNMKEKSAKGGGGSFRRGGESFLEFTYCLAAFWTQRKRLKKKSQSADNPATGRHGRSCSCRDDNSRNKHLRQVKGRY